ncbi:MAG: GAP family protein [Solirubrobacterales bacterium]
MGNLLPGVLPLALGAAISPLLLTATLLVLSGKDRPLARGFAVALGAALPLVALGIFGLVAFSSTGQPGGGGSDSEASAWLDLGLGLLLLALAALELRRRPAGKQSATAETPAPRSRVWRSALLGMGMMLANFTTAILYIAAVKQIARSPCCSASGST